MVSALNDLGMAAASTDVAVDRVRVTAGHTELSGGERTLMVRVEPDRALAKRFAGLYRRVGRVTLLVGESGVGAAIQGMGTRSVPFERRIPLKVALGFAQLGVPLFLRYREAPC